MVKNFDVIVVLGGGLKKDEQGWRTTRYDEQGDNFGVQGDRLRVDATYQMYRDFLAENNDPLILSSGGRGQLRNIPNSPTVASVIKKELLALGIPEEKILLEENSNNTYQQLQQLISVMQKLNLEDCQILSNRWHLPRIQAMIEFGPGLDFLKTKLKDGRIKLVSAEEILLDSNRDKWQGMIKAAFESEAMQERIKKEENGIEQIKSGSYKWQ